MTDIQNVVKGNPRIEFSLILQLTGVNGSRQFDRLTKTKTVESILTSMDEEGIKAYIDYLLKQVDEEPTAPGEYVRVPSFPPLLLPLPFLACPVLATADHSYRTIFTRDDHIDTQGGQR